MLLGVSAGIPTQGPVAPGNDNDDDDNDNDDVAPVALIIPMQLLITDKAHWERGIVRTCSCQYINIDNICLYQDINDHFAFRM